MIRYLMTDDERKREDEWNAHKFNCLCRYVKSMSKADQIKWAEKQSEELKNRVREFLRNETDKLKDQ